MKISYNWVKNYIDTELSIEKVAEKLTLSGLEVEGIEEFVSIPGGLEGIVIGEVLTCAKHPDADKLSVTTVDLGEEEPVQIVCGAPNVAAVQKVAVATVGAVLYPEDGEPFKIKKSKIRGEDSFGMICAEDELGLGHSHDGIMVLATDLPNGTPASEYFNIEKDSVIEIGLTPNRADATSHYGVARELKALLETPLKGLDNEVQIPDSKGKITIEVENTEDCPNYCGIEISNLKVEDSPEWLKNRLKSIGLEPINNVVDVTNYILHDLGQPLHAFDLAKIAGNKVIVKNVAEGTAFKTLDEVERKLKSTDLMICDAEKPMCIAGVFGGLDSGVSETTTSIFLESAYFAPASVRKSSLIHGLKTDASFRFERGTDPNMPVDALKKAAKLLVEIAGGEITSSIQQVQAKKAENFKVMASPKRINALIGLNLSETEVEKILNGLDITAVDKSGEEWGFSVPPYRVDVQREADLAEEVLRIYGFDQVELGAFEHSEFLASDNAQKDGNKTTIAQLLSSRGYHEMITNSLTNPAYTSDSELLSEKDNVTILNKLSEELGIMRRTLLFSGLEVVAHNVNRKQDNLKLYEFGKTYLKTESGYEETQNLGLFLTGNNYDESWLEKDREVQFHDLSADLLNVLEKLGVTYTNQLRYKDEFAAPGLKLLSGETVFAEIFWVSPKQLKKLNIKQAVLFANLNMTVINSLKTKPVVFEELSKFPSVRRDLSVVIDKNVSFADVERVTYNVNKKLIREVNVFDTFEGKQVGEGKKSYSISYLLQDNNQTLQDKVIDNVMSRLIKAYEEELGAIIRK